jgi:hypothetical protein
MTAGTLTLQQVPQLHFIISTPFDFKPCGKPTDTLKDTFMDYSKQINET